MPALPLHAAVSITAALGPRQESELSVHLSCVFKTVRYKQFLILKVQVLISEEEQAEFVRYC